MPIDSAERPDAVLIVPRHRHNERLDVGPSSHATTSLSVEPGSLSHPGRGCLVRGEKGRARKRWRSEARSLLRLAPSDSPQR